MGLRTKDGSKLLCKGWTVATKNEPLLHRLKLPCQKNHAKGKCESGQTAHTARYTDMFAKKVVDCFCEAEVWSRPAQELSQHSLEEAMVGDDIEEEAEEELGPSRQESS